MALTSPNITCEPSPEHDDTLECHAENGEMAHVLGSGYPEDQWKRTVWCPGSIDDLADQMEQEMYSSRDANSEIDLVNAVRATGCKFISPDEQIIAETGMWNSDKRTYNLTARG